METVELAQESQLDRLLVVGAQTPTVRPRPFDPVRVRQDLQAAVLKHLSGDECQVVVERVVDRLRRRYHELVEPLAEEDPARAEGFVGTIEDAAITHEIEVDLRQNHRSTAFILYALSVHGRVDVGSHGERRPGFADARSFLSWAFERYPSLWTDVGAESPMVPVEEWWPAGDPSTVPQEVVKRDGRTEAFDRARFEQSIDQALFGRRQHRKQTLRGVSLWVLWGLVGQQRVQTAQLGAGVAACLRRVDDIAYLRWASVAKGFTHESDFVNEALGLVRHPSVRLVFQARSSSPARPWEVQSLQLSNQQLREALREITAAVAPLPDRAPGRGA
ncbi:ATP cone domain-containing protein [Geodermatophilus sp. SYSU D00697]